MCILPSGSTKPVCLMCSETVALLKSVDVKQHYEIVKVAWDLSVVKLVETVKM